MSTLSIRTPDTRMPANLPPLTAKQLRDQLTDIVYIYNVGTREHRCQGPDKMYNIPACPEGLPYSAALVIPGVVYTTSVKKVVGYETELEWVPVDGVDVADDLLGTAPFKQPSENLVRWGVFSTMNPVPTSAEVERAQEQWYARLDEIVSAGDAAYAVNQGIVTLENGRSVSNISKDHLEAARILGLTDKPWAKKNVKMSSCPFCGVSINSNMAFCPNGDILDEAKARQARPWLFTSSTEERRGPGRPRNEVNA